MINVIEKKCYQNGKNSTCVIKFGFNDEDKVLTNVGWDIIRRAYNRFSKKYKAILTTNNNFCPTGRVFTVVGKAKCSPDDKFDAEKGMELAMQRAYQKVNAYNMKLIDMFSMELSDLMSNLDIKRHCSNNQLCENVIKISELSK